MTNKYQIEVKSKNKTLRYLFADECARDAFGMFINHKSPNFKIRQVIMTDKASGKIVKEWTCSINNNLKKEDK